MKRFVGKGLVRGLAALLPLCAGACTGRGHPPVLASAPTSEWIEQRTRAGVTMGRQFRDALDAQDTVAIVTSLAERVELITPVGDTIRGRASVASYLLSMVGASAPLRLFAGTVEPCRDGEIREYGGTFNAAPSPGSSAEFTTGFVRLVWDETDGGLQARRIDLAVRRADSRIRGCTPLRVSTVEPRRYVVTVGANWAFGGSPRLAATRDAMVARRFDYLPREAAPFPRVADPAPGVTGAVRATLSRGWTVEAQAAMRPPERADGVNAALPRRVVVTNLPIMLAALAQRQHGLLRVGAGPALLLQRTSVRETHERVYYMEAHELWHQESDTVAVAHGVGRSPGFAAQASMLVPVMYRVAAELHLGAAFHAASSTPATPHFPALSAANRTITFGATVGWGR